MTAGAGDSGEACRRLSKGMEAEIHTAVPGARLHCWGGQELRGLGSDVEHLRARS